MSLSVRFTADRSGVWPATVVQANALEWLGRDTVRGSDVLVGLVQLPAGTTLDRISAAVRTLLLRYDTLRTICQIENGEIRQVLLGHGQLSVDVIEIADRAPEDLEALVPRAPFDLSREMPLRLTVLTHTRTPVLAVLHVSHFAVDGTAMQIVLGRFQELLATSAGQDPPPQVLRQPVEQAIEERSPAAQRHFERTLRYWATQLRRTPLCMLDVPTRTGAALGYRAVIYESTT